MDESVSNKLAQKYLLNFWLAVPLYAVIEGALTGT